MISSSKIESACGQAEPLRPALPKGKLSSRVAPPAQTPVSVGRGASDTNRGGACALLLLVNVAVSTNLAPLPAQIIFTSLSTIAKNRNICVFASSAWLPLCSRWTQHSVKSQSIPLSSGRDPTPIHSFCIAKNQPNCHYSVRLLTGPRADSASRRATKGLSGKAAKTAAATATTTSTAAAGGWDGGGGGGGGGGVVSNRQYPPVLPLKR